MKDDLQFNESLVVDAVEGNIGCVWCGLAIGFNVPLCFCGGPSCIGCIGCCQPEYTKKIFPKWKPYERKC